MSATATPRRIEWRVATVAEVVEETSTVRTLRLDVPGWPGHLAGQHVDVRLTAEDGYQAERSYSIASPPGDARLALTIERLEDGEVSSHLCGEVRIGDRFELRGPIGGYFVWDVSVGGPLLLVAGGSGIVPLMAMLRHRRNVIPSPSPVIPSPSPVIPSEARNLQLFGAGSARNLQFGAGSARNLQSAKDLDLPARLLYSSRRWDEVIYRDELAKFVAADPTLQVTHTITREPPPGWTGFHRRIDRAMLADVGWPPSERPRIFICGPTPLVESAATLLVELGHDRGLVKTERFGPTGSPT